MTDQAILELHVWGTHDSKKLPTFSPDCLAAIWYIQSVLSSVADTDNSKYKLVVVRSSNTAISSTGALPALRHEGNVYGGYIGVVRHLKSIGLDLDANSLCDKATITSGLNYVDTQLSVISQYMLYAQSENYDAFTRPVISRLISFPMQYRVPLHQKDIAVRQCAAVGLLTANGANQKAGPEAAQRYPSLSKLQEQLEAARRESTLFMGRARDNMRVLAYCHEVFDTLLANKLIDSTTAAEDLEARGGKLGSVELLVVAHLRTQTLEELPAQVVATLLKNEYLELWQFLAAIWLQLSAREVEIAEAAPADVPNLTNYVKSFFY